MPEGMRTSGLCVYSSFGSSSVDFSPFVKRVVCTVLLGCTRSSKHASCLVVHVITVIKCFSL